MSRIILIMFWIFPLTHVKAKGREGGGGGSFVCRTGDTIYSAEFQDIWEAKKEGIQFLSTISLGESDENDEWDLSYQLIERLKMVSPKFYDQVATSLGVVKNIRFIDDVKLKPRGDSGHTSEPFSCVEGETDYLPVALYEGKTLTYSKKVWEKFATLLERSSTNVHEAIYKVLRDEYRDELSDRTRKIVGRLAEANINLTELKKWTPLSEFNANSTKSYREKYEELILNFNHGHPVEAKDLNSLSGICYLYEPKLFQLNPRENTKLYLNKEGEIKFFQRNQKLSSRYLKGKLWLSNIENGSFTYDRTDLLLGYTKSGNSYATERFYEHNGIHSIYVKIDQYFFAIIYPAKDELGNLTLIFPENDHGDGLKCKDNGFFSCREYEKVDILKIDPYYHPGKIVYCPKLK
ncbi:MAG: hypothetical protein QE271_00075 [Bacteriovoracaceae bacterium]|nr:hypothetical protein [Bacteriovoracaceae bacterium]